MGPFIGVLAALAVLHWGAVDSPDVRVVNLYDTGFALRVPEIRAPSPAPLGSAPIYEPVVDDDEDEDEDQVSLVGDMSAAELGFFTKKSRNSIKKKLSEAKKSLTKWKDEAADYANKIKDEAAKVTNFEHIIESVKNAPGDVKDAVEGVIDDVKAIFPKIGELIDDAKDIGTSIPKKIEGFVMNIFGQIVPTCAEALVSTISSASASAGLGAPHAHPHHQHFVDFTEALRPELLAEQLGRVLRGESVDVVVPQPQVPDYAGTGTYPGFRMVSPEERAKARRERLERGEDEDEASSSLGGSGTELCFDVPGFADMFPEKLSKIDTVMPWPKDVVGVDLPRFGLNDPSWQVCFGPTEFHVPMNVGKDMVDAFVAFIRPIFMEVVNAVTRIAKEVEEGIEKAIDGLEKVAKEVKGFGEDIEELMAKIKKVFGRRLLEDMDDEEREQLAREIIRTHIALLGKVERHTDKVRAKADNYVNVIERITLLELSKVHAALLGFNGDFSKVPAMSEHPQLGGPIQQGMKDAKAKMTSALDGMKDIKMGFFVENRQSITFTVSLDAGQMIEGDLLQSDAVRKKFKNPITFGQEVYVGFGFSTKVDLLLEFKMPWAAFSALGGDFEFELAMEGAGIELGIEKGKVKVEAIKPKVTLTPKGDASIALHVHSGMHGRASGYMSLCFWSNICVGPEVSFQQGLWAGVDAFVAQGSSALDECHGGDNFEKELSTMFIDWDYPDETKEKCKTDDDDESLFAAGLGAYFQLDSPTLDVLIVTTTPDDNSNCGGSGECAIDPLVLYTNRDAPPMVQQQIGEPKCAVCTFPFTCESKKSYESTKE